AYSSSIISNCVIAGNVAYGDGPNGVGGGGVCGGVYFNCTITGNRIGPGRCIGGGAHDAILSNCVIAGNSAPEVNGTGGGAHRCILYGCLVSNNTANAASGYGGGIAGWSAALPCKAYDCTIITNSASRGGGTYNSCILSNSTVIFNKAFVSGGGVSVSTLFNCAVISNTAPDFAVGANSCTLSNCVLIGNGTLYGIYYNCLIVGSQTLLYGNNGTYFRNCTISGCRHIYTDSPNYIPMINCISWSNRYADVRTMATNSCGLPGDQNNYTNVLLGNTTNNPMFITDGIGYGTNLVPGNYRLQAGSPCINIGANQSWNTNAVDLDNRPRIRYGTVDMGCYEHVFDGTLYGIR
ncbi:MAG: choice-of-anchor Q domain-containing protein, partial [Kiritimatiellia bacterium]